MRFSVQSERYRKMYGVDPPYPEEPIVCYYFRRTLGKIGERVDVVLSPACARHFRIWKPMALDKAKAGRIAEWNRKQELQQWL